ncbi:MAG: hypothetical protein IJT32_03670 [Lachnospiraceae bacterium]|nr:hypothetical protein [Lachnospiraceae bacterium]
MGMNKLQRQKQRHDILAAIEQEFVDEMVSAKLVTDRELQTEVLGVVMEDFAEEGLVSTGEFFFKPVQSDEEDVQLFCNVVTIMEELSQENLGSLRPLSR